MNKKKIKFLYNILKDTFPFFNGVEKIGTVWLGVPNKKYAVKLFIQILNDNNIYNYSNLQFLSFIAYLKSNNKFKHEIKERLNLAREIIYIWPNEDFIDPCESFTSIDWYMSHSYTYTDNQNYIYKKMAQLLS